MPLPLKKGDVVRLTHRGRSVRATVILASDNQRSLFLSFEGTLGGHIGGMALFKNTDGEPYRSIHNGEVASIEGVADAS